MAASGLPTVPRLLCLLCVLCASSSAATTRLYYLAAEEELWDYAPSGRDLLMNRPLPEHFDAMDMSGMGNMHMNMQSSGTVETNTDSGAATADADLSNDKKKKKKQEGEQPDSVQTNEDKNENRREDSGEDSSTSSGTGMRQRRDMHGAATWVAAGDRRIGRKYYKALFHEYTDATFASRRVRSAEWVHLGALGPVMRAEVGDTIKVELLNRASFPVSLHPHGVLYDKQNEGAVYADGTTMGDTVAPGERYTYTWTVRLVYAWFPVHHPNGSPQDMTNGPGDGSSVAWPYHSHVNEPRDTNTGLLGMLIVTAKGKARPDGSPKDVDREMVIGYYNSDETMSHLHERNVQTFLNASGTLTQAAKASLMGDADYMQSNLMHCINGYVYGNLPGLIMYVGERVRWYLMVLGNQEDMHTPHWHGNTLLTHGSRVDVLQLLPADVQEADMQPYNPGKWLFHCHVDHHIHGGMSALYEVREARVGTQSTHARPLASKDHSSRAFAAVFAMLVIGVAAYGSIVLWRKRSAVGGGGYLPTSSQG